MDDKTKLLNHLKNTLRDIPDKELEVLVDDIASARENFKVRYSKLMEFAELFTGALISVEVENHSAFPRAVEIEDVATGRNLGKIYFSPWQRKPVVLTTLAGGFGRMRLKYLKSTGIEISPFVQEGTVFRMAHPRAPL